MSPDPCTRTHINAHRHIHMNKTHEQTPFANRRDSLCRNGNVCSCTIVQVLDLEMNDLGAGTMRELAPILPQLTCLRELCLGRTQLMDEGEQIEKFCACLR